MRALRTYALGFSLGIIITLVLRTLISAEEISGIASMPAIKVLSIIFLCVSAIGLAFMPAIEKPIVRILVSSVFAMSLSFCVLGYVSNFRAL